jgi:hypothetical protein
VTPRTKTLFDGEDCRGYALCAGFIVDYLRTFGWFETAVRLRRFYKKTLFVLRGGLLAAAGLAFLVAAVGVPLPAGGKKDRSIPFPCMDRTCGCHDAAGCKAHCCCFSGEEKLAWAAAHDVDPSPFVDNRTLASLSHEGCVADDTGHQAHSASCCSKKAASSKVASHARDSEDPTKNSNFCDSSRPPLTSLGGRENTGGSCASSDRKHDTDGLLTIAAVRECTGLQPLWTLVGAALPPAEPVGYEFDWLPTGRVVQRDAAVTILSYSPPTPPPRS